MSPNPTSVEQVNNKEWLRFLEFVKRKYGEDNADFIRKNDYLKRENPSQSISQYYRSKIPSIGTQDLPLSELLKNPVFLTSVLGSNDSDIAEFTDIYNETNTLMKQLNSTEDNIYIKCNPVDDNGNVIDETNNSIGTNISSLNAMFGELGSGFSPMFLYSSIGMQTFISLIIFLVIYFIGKYIFIDYPKDVISRRI
jgi:hypothetical protein